MADDVRPIEPPPRSDRIVYYATGRVPPSARAWAEQDVLSGHWAVREWMRVAVFIGLMLTITVVIGGGSLGWRTVLVTAGVFLLLGVSTPLRRRLALNRIRKLPITAQPTATGMARDEVAPTGAAAEARPDPMQSFYSRKR